jgi:hypothetical protein
MIIKEGDLWEELENNLYTAVLIPTNGCVNKNGENVMGAGVARQVKDRYPETAKKLGRFLKFNMGHMDDPQWNEPWNVPYVIGKTKEGTHIFSFPTKPTWARTNSNNEHILGRYRKEISDQKRVPGWQSKSDVAIINRSARLISEVCKDSDSILLPAVGTGHGELKPDDVVPILNKYFDERYTVVVK